MADILVRCKRCGRETKISEFAAPGAVRCPGCGQPLEFTTAQKTAKLRLKEREEVPQPAVRSTNLVVDSSDRTTVKIDVLKDVHKARQKVRMPLAVWSWLTFALLGGLLVGVEYYVTVIDPRFMPYYLMGRWGVWGFVLLLVLIVAFEDSTAQGLLCLFVPLYVLYYALVRLEYYWVRGLFMAVLLGIGMELYYLPEQSAIKLAEREVNAFIVGVGKQIERASESPEVYEAPSKVPRITRSRRMPSVPQR